MDNNLRLIYILKFGLRAPKTSTNWHIKYVCCKQANKSDKRKDKIELKKTGNVFARCSFQVCFFFFFFFEKSTDKNKSSLGCVCYVLFSQLFVEVNCISHSDWSRKIISINKIFNYRSVAHSIIALFYAQNLHQIFKKILLFCCIDNIY